jgi:hypothetical protein
MDITIYVFEERRLKTKSMFLPKVLIIRNTRYIEVPLLICQKAKVKNTTKETKGRLIKENYMPLVCVECNNSLVLNM